MREKPASLIIKRIPLFFLALFHSGIKFEQELGYHRSAFAFAFRIHACNFDTIANAISTDPRDKRARLCLP